MLKIAHIINKIMMPNCRILKAVYYVNQIICEYSCCMIIIIITYLHHAYSINPLNRLYIIFNGFRKEVKFIILNIVICGSKKREKNTPWDYVRLFMCSSKFNETQANTFYKYFILYRLKIGTKSS